MGASSEGLRAYKMLHLQQVFLLTSAHEGGIKPHVIPQIWAMPASFSPELVAVAVANDRFTHVLISRTREFVLNVPGADISEKVWACAPPGEGKDKFARAGLTPVKAEKVCAPLVKECLAAIECRVASEEPAGDHTLFIGEVVAKHRFREGRVLLNAPGRHEFKA
ncbi:MAG: flavin reductase family protein [Candidatus ainarchaeum sp.]|nr:flavin reductase family protein [Candidatus ainarchaeum sp.]